MCGNSRAANYLDRRLNSAGEGRRDMMARARASRVERKPRRDGPARKILAAVAAALAILLQFEPAPAETLALQYQQLPADLRNPPAEMVELNPSRTLPVFQAA